MTNSGKSESSATIRAEAACVGAAAGIALSDGRLARHPPPPFRTGLVLSRRRPSRHSVSCDGRALGPSGGAAGLPRRALRERSRCPFAGVGRDEAGRLQYRYHSDWEKAREIRKARSLARLASVLPRIRRSLGQHFAAAEPTRDFAAAAVVDLVARSAIRPGRESYARERGTRGAATLLKSNVTVSGDLISLAFRSKGGKTITRFRFPPRRGHFATAAAAASGVCSSIVPRAENSDCSTRARGECILARHRRRGYHAEGPPHAVCIRERAPDLGATGAGNELEARPPKAGARGGRRHRGRSCKYAGDLPPQLRARFRRLGVRERRAEAIFGNAEETVARSARRGAGQDRCQKRLLIFAEARQQLRRAHADLTCGEIERQAPVSPCLHSPGRAVAVSHRAWLPCVRRPPSIEASQCAGGWQAPRPARAVQEFRLPVFQRIPGHYEIPAHLDRLAVCMLVVDICEPAKEPVPHQ